MRTILLSTLLLLTLALPARTDDDACVRMPCLGKCLSREETKGRAFPMLCMQQYACYEGVECAKGDDGKCGWKETPKMQACLKDKTAFAPPAAAQ